MPGRLYGDDHWWEGVAAVSTLPETQCRARSVRAGGGGVVTRSGKSFLCVLNVRIGERREHSLIRMTVLASTSRSVGGRSMPPGQGYGHHDLVTMRSCG